MYGKFPDEQAEAPELRQCGLRSRLSCAIRPARALVPAKNTQVGQMDEGRIPSGVAGQGTNRPPLYTRYLEQALAKMKARDRVWFTTGREIIQAYRDVAR